MTTRNAEASSSKSCCCIRGTRFAMSSPIVDVPYSHYTDCRMLTIHFVEPVSSTTTPATGAAALIPAMGRASSPRPARGCRRCRPGSGRRLLLRVTGYRGGSAGDLQPLEDVFQVLAYGRFGDGQPTSDLTVGTAGGDQSQQLLLPRGELWCGAATLPPFAIDVVEVGAQQREKASVTR